MSLFGLFQGNTPEAAMKKKEKARKLMDRGEEHQAMLILEKLLGGDKCPVEVSSEVRTLHADCRRKLASRNLELATSHLDAGDLEAAADFAATCLDYADDASTKDAANEIMQAIEKQQEPFGGLYHQSVTAEEADLPDDEGYAELLLEAYPAFIREAVTTKPDLKQIMVSLNRQDLETGKRIMTLPADDPAVRYFQTVFLSLSGEFDRALETCRPLIQEHLDLLDARRVADYLDLVHQADSDEPIEEIVNKVPELPVIRAAITVELKRENMEDAWELVQAGKSMMPPTRPDGGLFGLSGIIHYRRGEFPEAAEDLNTCKNLMASQGQMALPPEYALPLVDALARVDRVDEALETALHTVRAYGSTDAFAYARELAEKSSRDDLKRLVKRLENQ